MLKEEKHELLEYLVDGRDVTFEVKLCNATTPTVLHFASVVPGGQFVHDRVLGYGTRFLKELHASTREFGISLLSWWWG